MKKMIFSFFVLMACITTQAQLSGSKWTGTLQLEQPAEILLDFGKDTLNAITVGDGQTLETMTFTVKDNVLTIKKTSGQSECGYEVAGQYKIEMKDDSMVFTLVEDGCFNRAGILDKSKWIKKK